MSRIWFVPTGILLVAIVTACGKSEVATSSTAASTTESDQTKNTAPVAEAVTAAPETVPDKQSDETQDKAQALLMQNGLALAQKNNCLGCHTLDKKLVGPAWRDVAKKYKGVPGIEHKLIVTVSTGGVGNWGDMPMPAMAPAVKEEDIRALVKFVLSLE